MKEDKLLIQTLARIIGNKVYLRDLESLLAKATTPAEKQALLYLKRDLEQLEIDNQRSKRFF